MSLGKYLKELRSKKRVGKPPTVADVAAEIGISVSTLDFIEREYTKKPSDDTLEKLANYYGVEKKKLVMAMYEL